MWRGEARRAPSTQCAVQVAHPGIFIPPCPSRPVVSSHVWSVSRWSWTAPATGLQRSICYPNAEDVVWERDGIGSNVVFVYMAETVNRNTILASAKRCDC